MGIEEKTKVINLDITEFVNRLVEINRKANDYEYERLFKTPKEEAVKEILSILDNKLGQWEYELRYDIKKRGQNQ